jgi:N-methylhydantoinase A/oxoprolinase/acetone carboxylase beta subunit
VKRIAVDIGGTLTDIVYINEDTMQMVTDKERRLNQARLVAHSMRGSEFKFQGFP